MSTNAFKKMSSMFRSPEQKNFSVIVAQHIEHPDAPLLLEGTTGIGKTRAYLAALAQTNRSIAIVLPTHQLIEQLLESSDLGAVGIADIAAFRPARMFDSRAEYEAQREIAKSARVMICTAASVIIDQRLSAEYNGSTNRDYILFDEADQLPDMAALQSDFAITDHDLAEMNVKLTSAPDTLTQILAKPARTIDPEIRAAAKIILDAIDSPAWYHHAGLDDDGGIALTHKMPGRLLKAISNRPGVAFVSATLSIGGKFDDFRNAMGIDRASALSSIIEPANHGDLTFNVQLLDVDAPEWFPAVIDVIKCAPRPALVITPSHTLADQLASAVPGSVVREGEGDERENASEASHRVATNSVFITAGAWAGLDTKVEWKSIIIPRVPFGQPIVIDGEVTTHYLNARNTAVRRLRQGIGRGLRTPDAQCAVFILDGRITNLSGFVPTRFARAWPALSFSEGDRVEVVLSKAERDPLLRKAALRRFGARCSVSGCDVDKPHQLDVHHLDPVSEGSRRTTLDDVVVLCKNHHADAHYDMRQTTSAA